MQLYGANPLTLSPAQITQLQALTQDKPEQDRVVRIGANGRYAATVPLVLTYRRGTAAG